MSRGLRLPGDVLDAARSLLGRRLVSDVDNARVVVDLTEVEAYAGEEDPASHAFQGPTQRNRAMFGPAGTLYVYRSYGIHWCMNVVIGPPGVGGAILLRGAELVTGEDVVRGRRGRRDHLTDGPGKLAQALGVTDALDGHDLRQPPVQLQPPRRAVKSITTGPRVGISKATDLPWRFCVADWE